MNHTSLDQMLPVLESGTEVISWYFHDAKAEVWSGKVFVFMNETSFTVHLCHQ